MTATIVRTTTAPIPVAYMKTSDAARYLGLTSETLKLYRSRGTGPAFHRLGTGTILYRVSDLDAWVSQH